MDLRKGSDVPKGKRRCIRCRGRKKLYHVMGGWCFDNTGGTLKDCPMCNGKGHIDRIPVIDSAPVEKEKANGKKRRRKVKEKEY